MLHELHLNITHKLKFNNKIVCVDVWSGCEIFHCRILHIIRWILSIKETFFLCCYKFLHKIIMLILPRISLSDIFHTQSKSNPTKYLTFLKMTIYGCFHCELCYMPPDNFLVSTSRCKYMSTSVLATFLNSDPSRFSYSVIWNQIFSSSRKSFVTRDGW